jgi:hypothetical protein
MDMRGQAARQAVPDREFSLAWGRRKVGLVEGGRWIEPKGLRSDPNFNGYVVFLLPPP